MIVSILLCLFVGVNSSEPYIFLLEAPMCPHAPLTTDGFFSLHSSSSHCHQSLLVAKDHIVVVSIANRDSYCHHLGEEEKELAQIRSDNSTTTRFCASKSHRATPLPPGLHLITISSLHPLHLSIFFLSTTIGEINLFRFVCVMYLCLIKLNKLRLN
ncbi:hypothetical protein PENTCL1PPCAC_26154 [Pristionchus entomophagus]|uniref:G protein-coupled receptor n=1 Tax=Pristionchus entomophagus TaxID=358040 RepID=A0AAV5UAR2_9BILA|nr:hypothetical protein PENTCL1PPCAC_26154 [Pristionchus entomophagus]